MTCAHCITIRRTVLIHWREHEKKKKWAILAWPLLNQLRHCNRRKGLAVWWRQFDFRHQGGSESKYCFFKFHGWPTVAADLITEISRVTFIK